MRVLHLTTDSRIAGAERLLGSIAAHGTYRGIEPLVCTLKPAGPLHAWIQSFGGRAYSLRIRHGGDLPRGILELLQLLRAQKVDLLHTHLLHAGILAWMVSKVRRLPPHLHTRHHADRLQRFGNRRQMMIDRLAARSADHLVAVSEAVKRYMVETEKISRTKITVIHNGIVLPQAPGGTSIRVGPPVIAAVGSLQRWKGHTSLIQAISRVRNRVPDVQLQIFGEGPERPNLQAMIQSLQLQTCVHLCGHSDRIQEALSRADLLVHPSLEEGFGIAMLEGMAQGRAVVATRVGGIPEVVEDGVTGMLVPPGEPEAMASAILCLLEDDDLRHRMGLAGRRRVQEHFSLEHMLARYAELYASLPALRQTGSVQARK